MNAEQPAAPDGRTRREWPRVSRRSLDMHARDPMDTDRYPAPSPSGRASGLAARPRWGFKTSFLFAVAAASLICGLVLTLVKDSLWVKLEVILAALSGAAFLFFFVVLYRGVRFDEQQGYVLGWLHPRTILDQAPAIDSGFGFTEAGASEGIAGLLLGLLLDIIASIVLAFAIALLIWLGVKVLITAVAAVFLPLYYLFRRSIRYLVVRGRSCRGQVGRSLAWAAGYTAVNFAWLFAILALGRFFAARSQS